MFYTCWAKGGAGTLCLASKYKLQAWFPPRLLASRCTAHLTLLFALTVCVFAAPCRPLGTHVEFKQQIPPLDTPLAVLQAPRTRPSPPAGPGTGRCTTDLCTHMRLLARACRRCLHTGALDTWH